MDGLLELIDAAKGKSWLATNTPGRNPVAWLEMGAQLLEIAVSNVVTAPVGHGIELNAVGELHVVLLVKSADLLGPPGVPLSTLRLTVLDARVVDEFEFLEVCELVCAGRGEPPFFCQPRRGRWVEIPGVDPFGSDVRSYGKYS
jgi:hypothetical protein